MNRLYYVKFLAWFCDDGTKNMVSDFFSLLPMKNAADVLHQQQHSIELASAISKIRLHFPMHSVSNRIMLMQCPHSGQILIHRVSNE
jgi:hypothetical protein